MLKFYYNLFREKRASGPDKQFKRSLQKKLQTAWGELYPSRLMWYQMPAFKYIMVALAVLIFISTTGVGVYAYNSPEVTEGTRLYGIKRAIERVEEKVVERRAPEVQAKFYLKQIERREAEKRIVEKRRAHEVQLQKTQEKLNLNPQPYEKSNYGVSGDDGSVGNDSASTSSQATGQGKAKGKSTWGRIKQRILNTGESPSQVRTSTGVNTR